MSTMPDLKICFHIPASPTDSFYSQVAMFRLALDSFGGIYKKAHMILALGAEEIIPLPENWKTYFADTVKLNWADPQHYQQKHFAAQGDVRWLYDHSAYDIVIFCDADTLLIKPIDDVLMRIQQSPAAMGVITHYPFSLSMNADDHGIWTSLAAQFAGKPIDFKYRHTLVTSNDVTCPFYVNFGFVVLTPTIINTIKNTYIDMWPEIAAHPEIKYPVFSPQIALTLSLLAHDIPTQELGLRYNFPNDPVADNLHPEELADVRLIHYLRTDQFDRHTIFASEAAFYDFLALKLDGSNKVLQNHVRKLTHRRYPFNAEKMDISKTIKQIALKPPGNKVTVVLGMHRSGTSAIARSLQVLGVGLGDNLHPAGFDNPKGFWEDRECIAINEELLSIFNSAHDRLGLSWNIDLEDRAIAPLYARAVNLVNESITQNNGSWGVKDPRMCRLLGFWKKVFNDCGCDVRYVISLRNPMNVAQSLRSRNQIAPEKSHYLWLQHVVPAILETQGETRIVVDYDTLLESPIEQVIRMSDRLRLPLDDEQYDQLREFSETFLETDLRHGAHSVDEMELDHTIPNDARTAYKVLLAVARDELSIDSDEIQNMFETMEANLRSNVPAFDYANTLEAERADLYQVIADRDAQIAAQGDVVQSLTVEMEKYDHQAHMLVSQVSEKDQQIDGLWAQLAEKERQAYEFIAQVKERDLSLQELSSQLADHKLQLTEITKSKAWKTVLLLRRIRSMLFPVDGFGTRILRRLVHLVRSPFKKTSQNLAAESELIRASTLFDEAWYLAHNPEVAESKIDPALHYLKFGAFEGRDPGPDFNSRHYLRSYRDVRKSKINPLLHYLTHGLSEDRKIMPSNDNPALRSVFLADGETKTTANAIRHTSTMNLHDVKVSVVIPTKNAGPGFQDTLEKIAVQNFEGEIEIIAIDSGSTDDTVALASRYGAIVTSIPPGEFNHGLTRNRAIEMASGDIIVLMSQDVIPGNEHLIHNFVTAFDDPTVAGAYARQQPREDADLITRRNLEEWFTGRSSAEIRQIQDWDAYLSLSPMEHFYFCNFDNVCSAIRKTVWHTLPFRKNDFGEDIEWAQQALEAGWKIAYWPSSYVIHSHPRSFQYEYSRNRLCHKKLSSQFGIRTVPSLKHVVRSTMVSTKQDWAYLISHEKKPFMLLQSLIRTPLLSFASVYGQFHGAIAGLSNAEKPEPHQQASQLDGKLRIILTTHQFLPDYSSGTEILTFETAKELQRQGHQVSVVTGFPAQAQMKDKERFDRYTIDGIDVVRFYYNHAPMGDQANVIELEYYNRLFGRYFKKYLQHESPSVVHFFHLMRLSAVAVDVCHELHIPTVFTPTDFWFICPTCQLRLPDNTRCAGPDKLGVNCLRHVVANNQSDKIKTWLGRTPDWVIASLIFLLKRGFSFDGYYSSLIRALSFRREFLLERMNRIDKVMVPTSIMMSALTSNGLEKERTISLPFGLNLTHLQHVNRPEPGQVLRLGYIGTLAEHKGVHILIDAMKQVASKDVELKIYGKLDDFPEYGEDLTRNSRGDPRIKFCGTFPNHKIGEIFSELDVLVVPSLWHENSPLVVYSAQAAKCPVIASNMEGLSETIEHGKNGLLFEAGNVSELASAITQLIGNLDLLNRFSKNSKSPLSMQGYVNELVKVYRSLTGLEEIT